jgi:hypothetical protein
MYKRFVGPRAVGIWLSRLIAICVALSGLAAPVFAQGLPQTITSALVNGQWANPITTSVFSISATASSGLPVTISSTSPTICTISGNALTPVAVGTCTYVVSQAGDSTYLAVDANKSFVVSGYPQSITFDSPTPQTLGSLPFSVSATASSGLAVAYSSLSPTVCSVLDVNVTLVAVGTCLLQATQPGDSNYAAASPVVRSFGISMPVTPGPVVVTDGDVPLPPWAYVALGLLLLAGMARQRRRA